MIWIKISLFALNIVTVKYIFKFINDYGDECVNSMKELLDFTDFLRIYSCDMKLSLEEICLKYHYKSEDVKKVIQIFESELTHSKNKHNFQKALMERLKTPETYNKYFSDILDYYGSTYSDVLDKKLLFTQREMERSLREFESSHTEKKNLNNRISVLVGCLAAVILI